MAKQWIYINPFPLVFRALETNLETMLEFMEFPDIWDDQPFVYGWDFPISRGCSTTKGRRDDLHLIAAFSVFFFLRPQQCHGLTSGQPGWNDWTKTCPKPQICGRFLMFSPDLRTKTQISEGVLQSRHCRLSPRYGRVPLDFILMLFSEEEQNPGDGTYFSIYAYVIIYAHVW